MFGALHYAESYLLLPTLFEESMKPKLKKVLLISTLIILVCAVAYITFIGYMVSNGFRDYVSFCSTYISQIDEYKSKTGQYPKSLKELNKPKYSFRYEVETCKYYAQTNIYGFTVPKGLIGQAFYSSKSKKWTYD